MRTSNASQPNAKSTGDLDEHEQGPHDDERRAGSRVRRIGVASIRFTSFFVRISTMR